MSSLKARILSTTLVYLTLILFAAVFVLPLLWMVSSSLKSEDQVLTIPPSFLPLAPQWLNYVEVFDRVSGFLGNSIKLALLNVVGAMVVASLAGYAFARLSFPGKNVAFLVLLGTAIVPSMAYLIPQYVVFREMGWLDTHYPLWVPKVLTPVFGTFLMRQAFMTIPRELEDAAKLDGASVFRTYWQIMLPQTKTALAAIAVFSFVESWNDLFGPLIFLSSPELQTLPVALAQFQSEYFTEVSLLMAGATISILPMIAVFLFAQHYFVQGITSTGLNG
jgi:multiple sugar transport system permease protein